MPTFIPGTENHNDNKQRPWLFLNSFGKWGGNNKSQELKFLTLTNWKRAEARERQSQMQDQPLRGVKMLKVKQEKECLLPAGKWVWEVVKNIFWYLKEPLFSSKQLKVKRARWGLGLQWLTTVRSCPTSGSLNNGFLYMVVYRRLAGTTSSAKNWDKLYFSERALLQHSSEGFLSIYLYFCYLLEQLGKPNCPTYRLSFEKQLYLTG